MSERTKDAAGAASGEVESLGDFPRASTSGRTFDEKAVADILQRAAALDRQAKAGGASLSVSELEQIAREAGIDPAMVRRAIEEREAAKPAATGAPMHRLFERMVDVELTAEKHELLAATLRTALAPVARGPVQVSSLGRSLTASCITEGRAVIEVHVVPDGGRTRITVSINARRLAGRFFGGFMAGGGLGIGTQAGVMTGALMHTHGTPGAMAVAAGFGIFATVLSGAYAAARTLFTSNANRLYELGGKLADDLSQDLKGR